MKISSQGWQFLQEAKIMLQKLKQQAWVTLFGVLVRIVQDIPTVLQAITFDLGCSTEMECNPLMLQIACTEGRAQRLEIFLPEDELS